jgi:hypothetical protein
MTIEDYIAEALEMVSAWEIRPEDLAQVVNDQAKIMAGLDLALDLINDTLLDDPHQPLQF